MLRFFLFLILGYSYPDPPDIIWPHVSYQRQIEWTPLQFNSHGYLQSGVKTTYYPSGGEFGNILTVVAIGNCLDTLEIPPCSSLPVGWGANQETLSSWAFQAAEPSTYNPEHLVDPLWPRYPPAGSHMNIQPIHRLLGDYMTNGIAYHLNMSLAMMKETCVKENGDSWLIQEVDQHSLQYRYNMSLTYVQPLHAEEVTFACEQRLYGLSISRQVDATIGFHAQDVDFQVLDVQYTSCPLEECRDHFHDPVRYQQYYHVCTGMSPSYRLSVTIQMEYEHDSSPLTPLRGIVGANDILRDNNGCFGFPFRERTTWNVTRQPHSMVTLLHLQTECLNLNKGWVHDCGRFHTCDADGNGALNEEEHQQYDYSIAITPRKCPLAYEACLYPPEDRPLEWTMQFCQEVCPLVLTSEVFKVQLTLKYDKCPETEQLDLLKVQCDIPLPNSSGGRLLWQIWSISATIGAGLIWYFMRRVHIKGKKKKKKKKTRLPRMKDSRTSRDRGAAGKV